MRWWGLLITAATFGVGTVFPALRSVEALESKSYSDDAQWLTYWVMVALLAIVERFAYPVIAWMPLYAEAKLVLLCWLALPPFSGATLVYLNARPVLVQATLRIKTFVRQIRGVDEKALKEEAHYSHLRTRMATVENGVSASLASLFNDVLAGDADESALDKQLKKYESALPSKAVGHGEIKLPIPGDSKQSGAVHRVRASVPDDKHATEPDPNAIHSAGHDLGQQMAS